MERKEEKSGCKMGKERKVIFKGERDGMKEQ